MSLYMHYKYIYVNINYNLYTIYTQIEAPWTGGQKAHFGDSVQTP